MRIWILAATVVTAGAALSAGTTPWQHALAGAFAPPDLAQDVAAARVLLDARNPYRVGIAAEHARLMGAAPDVGYPHFPHPPLAVAIAVPLAPLGLRAAAHVWFLLSLGLLWLLAGELARLMLRPGATASSGRTQALAFIALLVWPPVLYNLEKGQWSILVAWLLALTWRYGAESRHRAAGICTGFAGALKLFPVLLLGYLLLRQPRALTWALIVLGCTVAIPLVIIDAGTLGAFLQQSRANLEYWETWPAVTYSIHAAVTRTFVGGTWARPLLHSPTAAVVLETALTGLLVVATVGVTLARTRTSGRFPGTPAASARGDGSGAYAASTAALVVLNPLSMGHNGVLLALPIVLVGVALRDDPRRWLKMVWVVGVALASIPRQALVPIQPVVVEGWTGLAAIALPMCGALLLVAASIAVAFARPAAESAARASVPDVGAGAP